jgi:hypothetical protein
MDILTLSVLLNTLKIPVNGYEYWLYFQATRDRGKRFQIGLARQPVPSISQK